VSDNKDDNQSVVWAVLVSVVVLAVSLAIGFGIAKSKKAAPAAPAVTAAEPAAVEAAAPAQEAASAPVVEASAPAPAPAPVLSANESAVRVENGVVKFYFATGKAVVAAGAKQALAEVVQAAAQGKKLVISGYHDSTGSAATNALLAKQRAQSVKAALMGMGVKNEQMTIKDAVSVATTAGADAQARRVEVAIE
jgi:outer membrane protein OmpA-like peptidoglycan-associated protein